MEDLDVKQGSFEGWAETTQLAYVAGLFDGEGCVYISRKKSNGVSPSFGVHVSLSNGHEGIVNLLKGAFGGYVKHYTETRVNQRDWFCWQLSGGKMAAVFLASIRPYTFIKSEQIDLALEFGKRISARSWRLSDEEIAIRDSYRNKITEMKWRKTDGITEGPAAA